MKDLIHYIFEENNLNTLDTKASEILLTTLSAVAQQESEIYLNM